MSDKTSFRSQNLETRMGGVEDRIVALERKMRGYFLNEIRASSNINIDTITNEEGYIYRMITGSGALGTQPTSIIGGNAYILIGFSLMSSQQTPKYGVQIAFGFGENKIAIRHATYNASGGSWSAWTAV